MKKPSGSAPKRNQRKRPERRVIRVLTEGAVTEPHYLTLLARDHRHRVTIRHDSNSAGSAPLTLVRAAREQQRASNGRRKAEGPDFDQIWCVFDTDEHPNLKQTLAEAANSGVLTAVSNPCFELWLVLHVEDQNAHVHGHDIQRRAHDFGLVDGKSICDAAAEELLLTNCILADIRYGRNGPSAALNPQVLVSSPRGALNKAWSGACHRCHRAR